MTAYRQLTVNLMEYENQPKRRVQDGMRAFNDGLAFRYVFPASNGDSLIVKAGAFVRFRLPAILVCTRWFFRIITVPTKEIICTGYIRKLPKDSLIDMPVLLEFS